MMRKNKVISQHYIPQFLMKKFKDSVHGFCVYKIKDDNIITRTNTKSFATSNKFYDVNESDLKDALSMVLEITPKLSEYIDLKDENFVENYFAKIEYATSILLNRILKHDYLVLSNDDRMLLILFLYDLAHRTLFYRDKVDNFANDVNAILEDLGRAYKLPKEQIELSKASTGKTAQINSIFNLKGFVEFTLMIFNEYEIYYAKNNTGLGFILSDNPSFQLNTGFNDFCLPISSERALVFRVKRTAARMLTEAKNNSNVIELSWSDVRTYNIFNFLSSYMYVFGNKTSLEQLKTIINISNI